MEILSRVQVFNLKTNLDSKQYLINVKSYKNQNSEDFESYIARPFLSKRVQYKIDPKNIPMIPFNLYNF